MATPPKSKLAAILARLFRGAEVEVHAAGRRSGDLAGSVVWRGFGRLGDHERVRRIRDVIGSALTPVERKRVVAVWPYTPVEWKVKLEERAFDEALARRSRASG